MRWLLILLLMPTCTNARVVWQDQGFKLETAGWVNGQDWTGIQTGLTIPDGGVVELQHVGALEFWIPCLDAWIPDEGILIMQGCGTKGGNTRVGSCVLTQDLGCSKQEGRIIMVVRLRKFFTSPNCIPTKARWVQGKANHAIYLH